uniref:uncharacterized protein LOC106996018 isoform X3 n=1 Tax=Macaca mulatta TaxID=9544 RepID=UPI0010A2158A|nr:uncharacterized protein LOC106996018 isoform X3 [Macaca mulatta]
MDDAGSRNMPARMTKPQAESGGSGASSQPQACPDAVGERLRTDDAGSRNAPSRMTKPQAESGGSGAASQPQACPDAVGIRYWIRRGVQRDKREPRSSSSTGNQSRRPIKKAGIHG